MYVSSSAAVTDAEHQAAAAHVAAADEIGGKQQSLPEDALQHVDVLGRSDAAEEHDRAVRPDVLGDGAGADFERAPVLRVGGVDVDAGEVPERGERHGRVDRSGARRSA